jgi:Carboxypeptidase regulatory-like domain
MRTRRALIETILAGLLVLLPGTLVAEVICSEERPLKPVRCVCGTLIDESGEPISGALVRLNQSGVEFATISTDAEGKFWIRGLKSGRYELTAHSDGFRSFQSQIVVMKPVNKCQHELVIVMVLPFPDNCGSYVMKR